MKKRTLTLLLALVLVFGLLPVTALAVTDSEPNDTLATAQNFTMGETISGGISENEDADWYKFTLDASGRISLKVTSYMEYYSVWLYNDEGNQIWRTYENEWNPATGMRVDNYDIDLTEGTYYVKISGEYSPGLTGNIYYSSGNYTITTSYINANVDEAEPNDTIQESQQILLNGTFNGQCALNNRNDYFKIELPADGQLTLTFTSYMEYYSVWLFDSDGNQVWRTYENEWNPATASRKDFYALHLLKGIYYIKVSAEYSPGLTGDVYYSSGNYTMATSYISANVDETEPNDTIQKSQQIPLNKVINGQCALNNRNDYYKITLPDDGRFTLTFTSYMEYYSVWLFDSDGNQVWRTYENEWNASTGIRVDTYDIDLITGIYYIKVSAEYSPGLTGNVYYSSGNYSFKLNTENPFDDVPADSFYNDPVLWAVENGITAGASADSFDPDGKCLRAHVVTFLHRAAKNPEPSSHKNPFTDVKPSDFFYKPVLWAGEKGITNGISGTKFGSYDVCNRAAVVTFLWRAAGSPEPKSTANPFTDVKSTDFFYKPVLWAVENDITNGISATAFGPTSPCNRAQVVTFLYRAYN